MSGMQKLTIKLRLRDKHSEELCRQARAVSYVWNYCNETQQKAAKAGRKWLSGYDLGKLTAGSSKMLNLHAHTIMRVASQYETSRKQHRKPWLRWRGRKSLGWVPFNTGHVSFDGVAFKFRGESYETMHLRDVLMPGIKIGAGSFNQDARARWYINLPVEVATADSAPASRVGVDLGLKSLAVLSDGSKIEAPRLYRASEAALATAQKRRKSKRTKAIHAKIANRRKDFLHKASAKLAKQYGLIVIGDVSPTKIAKTRMAKSSIDAGWGAFKGMLSYKAIRHGGSILEVSERYTTQVCSCCGSMGSSTRPKGIAGLGIREWTCVDCGTTHDRDVNAAQNILRTGLCALTGGAHV